MPCFSFIFFIHVMDQFSIRSTLIHSNTGSSFSYQHKWSIVPQLDRITFCSCLFSGILQSFETHSYKKNGRSLWSITIFWYRIRVRSMRQVVCIRFDIFLWGFVVSVRVKGFWGFIDIVRWTVNTGGCWIFCFWLEFIDWMPF